MTVTTAEAAEILQTSEANVWKLVAREKLTPIRPGAKPLEFDEDQVLDLRYQRRTSTDRAQLRAAAEKFCAWQALSIT